MLSVIPGTAGITKKEQWERSGFGHHQMQEVVANPWSLSSFLNSALRPVLTTFRAFRPQQLPEEEAGF